MLAAPLTIPSVLVVARPGRLCDSLVAFLRAVPSVGLIHTLADPALLIETIHSHHPHTVIVDADTAEDVLVLALQQLADEWPTLNRVALVTTLRQQHTFELAGATHILFKGFLHESLRAAVTHIAEPGGVQ